MKKKLLIANWKMFLTYNQEQALLHHISGLPAYDNLVICPSFVSLATARQQVPTIALGAQDCSQYAHGAFTGEVAAASLKEVGCSYCIVGHLERRILFDQQPEDIVLKAQQLLQHDITPIIWVGESALEKEGGSTKTALEQQLAFFELLDLSECIIAYEPAWAIGTGIVPSLEDIETAISYIKEHTNGRIVYGGSINPDNIQALATLPLDGFLIGKASTDFNNLKKMIELI